MWSFVFKLVCGFVCLTCFFCEKQRVCSSWVVSVEEYSLTSPLISDELLILLNDENFLITTNVILSLDLNETYGESTLYYRVRENGQKTLDSGSFNVTILYDNTSIEITTNEMSVSPAGEYVDISFEVSLDDDSYTSTESYESYKVSVFAITGFTSLVPLIFVIFFAGLLKNPYVSLYLTIWIGGFIVSGLSFRYAFEDSLSKYILTAAANDGHQFVILFTVFLSGLVYLIRKSGGTVGFSNFVKKYARSGKETQLTTFGSGLLLFFDDYANALVVGTTFKSLTDAFEISREKLAFLVDSTSAPIASLIPLSSWIGFELQLIQAELDDIVNNNNGEIPDGLTDNAWSLFLDTIPTRFYPLYMIVFQLNIILLSIEFGPMLIAERRVKVYKRKDGGDGRSNADENNKNEDGEEILDKTADPDKDTPPRWWNMFVPIFVLIVLILSVIINTGVEGATDDDVPLTARNIFSYTDSYSALLYGTFGASIFTLAFLMIQFKKDGNIVPPDIVSCKHYCCSKYCPDELEDGQDENNNSGNVSSVATPLLPFSKGVETWIKGIVFMTDAVCLLILVWSIGHVMTDIGANRYFARVISDNVDAEMLPTIVFILSAFISGVTGTSWGTMTIMFPLVSPATWAVCESLPGDEGIIIYKGTLSSILSGSIWGDHSSPLSDTTLLSSAASSCNLFKHVKTQLPYALWVAMFSIIFGTILLGYGVPAGWTLVIGIIVQTIFTSLLGVKVISSNGKYDIFTELYMFIQNKINEKNKYKNDNYHSELIELKEKTIEMAKNEGIKDDKLFDRVKQWRRVQSNAGGAGSGATSPGATGVSSAAVSDDKNDDMKEEEDNGGGGEGNGNGATNPGVVEEDEGGKGIEMDNLRTNDGTKSTHVVQESNSNADQEYVE